ncbi:MAG: YceI family protein [Bacteroidota bacterium]
METAVATKTWEMDPMHSEIHFKVKHMMVSTVTGAFDEFSGKVAAKGEGFENADVSFSAKTASINTRNADRDAHLKSDDFFNAEQYPELSFSSKSFTKKNEEEYELVGDLTIRDVTKEVTLRVLHEGTAVDPYGQNKAGFEITGKINRKDFELKWSAVTEAGSIVVSEEVRLALNVQLIEK